jgi:hypothetical protein
VSVRRRTPRPFRAVVFGVLCAVLIGELAARVVFGQPPSSTTPQDVLFLTPDRVIGWKLVESFRFRWSGRNPYCVEFGVDVATNSLGFRDREWSTAKPTGTIRIAVLGDSFVEGIQVPVEHTFSRVLEDELARRLGPTSIETMNFGVSNFSLAQLLMTYQEYVRRFDPDYVVVFASYLNYSRTTERALSSRLQKFYTLRVRPSYALGTDGTLVYLPAEDYDQYVAGVKDLVANHYGEDRANPVPRIASTFRLPYVLLNTVSHHVSLVSRSGGAAAPNAETTALNHRILEELDRAIDRDGGRLIFADAFEYLEAFADVPPSGALKQSNRSVIDSVGARYVDVSAPLRATQAGALFGCDKHFNSVGHRTIATAIADVFDELLAS